MAQAEIFRIIDVTAQAEPVFDESQDSAEQGTRADEQLAVWESPGESTAIVPHGPAPTVTLEYVTLPHILDDRLVLLREPTSAKARSFRLLRHRLLSGTDPRIVAVTSARSGDGKTTCAVNLALAIAEDAMTRVLVLDANLQRPALGRVFGFEPATSFVDQIVRSREVVPPYPVACIGGTRLHVAALPAAGAPGARLERTLFSVALTELREAYDYVVIDAGSVLESADTDVIGECTDGVVVAVRASRSSKRDLRRTIDQLCPATVLGSVLLDV